MKPSSRIGRPPLPARERRAVQINFSLTASEARNLDRAVAACKDMARADVIRHALRKMTGGEK